MLFFLPLNWYDSLFSWLPWYPPTGSDETDMPQSHPSPGPTCQHECPTHRWTVYSLAEGVYSLADGGYGDASDHWLLGWASQQAQVPEMAQQARPGYRGYPKPILAKVTYFEV